MSTALFLAQAGGGKPLTALWIILGYLALLMLLGGAASLFFRGTSKDYFVASRSIGPFLLLMSVFGTTMTGFALVGSTAKSFELGIGVYGLMASWSGLVHSAVFFLVGIRLWAIGKRYNYMTQVQFFRDRFQSEFLGYVLFAILVALVVPYLLVGIIAACKTIQPITAGMFPETFAGVPHPVKAGVMMFKGAIPPWLTALVICGVVLFYVFFGGIRSAAWANTFQTLVFMVMGVVTFTLIAKAMGGLAAASEKVLEVSPKHAGREGMIGQLHFLSYIFIPLSVGMFPHLFQHWLTARSAKTFRLTVIAHPVFIAIVWIPCVLIGMWAAGLAAAGELSVPNANAVLGRMVASLVESHVLTGLLTAGILAAIMSSLDSQFVCLGTMFTNDVVVRLTGPGRFTDRQLVWLARGFVVFVVAISYALSMALLTTNVFNLGVWCFSGFAALFPLVFAALYWKRTTRAGAIACILTTAAVWLVLILDALVWIPAENPAERIFGHIHRGEYLIKGLDVMPVAAMFLASVVSLVVVSLATKPLPAATIDKFFEPRAAGGSGDPS
ncbi:MAG: sodium:solute symporter family protein [Phycisphaerae bacterium]|nr:sodium:solute symporter family protein [Phycisphaerae bacterium]